MKKRKRIIAIILCMVCLINMTSCSRQNKEQKGVVVSPTSMVSSTPTVEPTLTPSPTIEPTAMPANLGEAGIVIDRDKHDEVNTNKVKDSWTILIYLCGTDLESNGLGYATGNLQELFDVTYNENVKIIVQTGGTIDWQQPGIKPDRLERFIVEDGGLKKVGEAKLASMGDGNTLYEFLSWGVHAYPADRTGVILWDHGSGSIGGVVYDEVYSYDSLSLLEMDDAFRRVYYEMDCDFEFIGFDACLMATIEVANIAASYANYMIASQEYEGGAGWDYDVFAQYLVDTPTANGMQVGTVICDSFAEKSCAESESTDYTLSVIDLDKVDKLLYAFDTVAKKMSESTNKPEIVSELAKGAFASDRFGAYSEYEGYSNLIDLGIYTLNVSQTVGGAAANAITFALKDAVVYKVCGEDHKDATGLSVYYPLLPEYEGLSTISGICVSPYYLIYIDAITYGSTGENITEYNSDYWDDNYGGYYGDYYGDESSENEDWYTCWDEHWEEYDTQDNDDFDFSAEESSMIQYAVSPHMSDDGYYTLTIDEDSIDYVQGVYCTIFADMGNDEQIYLGMDSDVSVDWNTGVVEDSFYGYWPSLPDNQHLEVILVNETDEYNLYSIPILLNGEETNLRIKWVWDDPYDSENNYGSYQVVGAWDGIDTDTGMAAKDTIPIVAGDVITPMYVSYNSATDVTTNVYGEEYTVTEEFYIDAKKLDAGDYYYCFELVDIFGTSLYTDYTTFTIDEAGEIYY